MPSLLYSSGRTCQVVNVKLPCAAVGTSVHRRLPAASLAIALFIATSHGALAQVPPTPSDSDACLAANRSLSLDAPLPQLCRRL
jgi:hypothetical protein